MASIFLRSGKWRAQVRRAGMPAISETFTTKVDAQRWARAKETEFDRADFNPAGATMTFEELVDIYKEMTRTRPGGTTKQWTVGRLQEGLGHLRMTELTKRAFLDYAQRRVREGAGPATLLQDFTYLRTVLRFGGPMADVEDLTAAALVQFAAARDVLIHAGKAAASEKRERRPTDEELAQLEEYFFDRPRSRLPMWDMTLFAIATAMRLGEIVRIEWEDFDERARTVIIRDRKDPKKKKGNDGAVPLLRDVVVVKGEKIDPVEIMLQQRTARNRVGRVFPYATNTLTLAFTRATEACGIEDLHFHDLRHDAVSRLFEAGYRIEEVALVSGHKSWKNLQRYTHLRPASLHRS
jgi:integrase